MSTSFSYISRFLSEAKKFVIPSSSAKLFDAKQKIVDDLKSAKPNIQPSQVIMFIEGKEVKDPTSVLLPNTLIKVQIKEIEEKKEIKTEVRDTKDVYIETDEKLSAQIMNLKTRKQQPKQLPPNYICHRCGKKGHYIKDCPENNNPAYDKKEAAGLPMEMYEEARDDDPNAKTLKDGRKVVLKITGEQFKPTIVKQGMSEEFEIPKRLKCNKCGELLRGASFLKCCEKTLCEDCLNEIRKKEMCSMCGKPIDISKDIIIDKKIREEINKYFDTINEQIAKQNNVIIPVINTTSNTLVNSTSNRVNKMEIDDDVILKHKIDVIDITGLFKGSGRLENGREIWKLSNLKNDFKFDGKLLGISDNVDDIISKSFKKEENQKRSRSHSRDRSHSRERDKRKIKK